MDERLRFIARLLDGELADLALQGGEELAGGLGHEGRGPELR